MTGKPGSGVLLSYGRQNVADSSREISGGLVKFQRLQQFIPSSPFRFNIIYLGSSSLPKDWRIQLQLARFKGAKIVYNQDGVAFPAWHGPGWEETNRPMARILREADYVFYQSAFCKYSSDRFLGLRNGPWEILHNAVDTDFFAPLRRREIKRRPVLLLGGMQYQFYPLETAFQTISRILRRYDVELVVTGRLTWIRNETEALRKAMDRIHELRIEGHVSFAGPFSQNDAPDLYRTADILLHTKVNDPCPSVVIEAMACGLPVVYASSGGVPELVGPEAGIGVPVETDWEKIRMADPEALAAAFWEVWENCGEYSKTARQRAVSHFDLKPWVQRHREVFHQLLQRSRISR